MKIYLAGSIAGGREFEANIKLIANVIKSLGHEIISPFVVDIKLNEDRFPGLEGKELAKAHFDEDLDLVLNQADAFVAEVSQPSHGVGVEIGAITTKKMLGKSDIPVLLLTDDYLKNKKISSLVYGNPYAVFEFFNKDSIKNILIKNL